MMSRKKPSIYLTNSNKKHCCSVCGRDLVFEDKEFEMKSIKGKNPIIVSEELLYCDNCDMFYITQFMSRELVKKYVGFYLDVSTYTLKSSKKVKNSGLCNENESGIESNKNETIDVDKKKTEIVSSPSGLNVGVHLSNTYSTAYNICPLCNSVLCKEVVNVPVIKSNGDFYRYYSEEIKVCIKCRKAYLPKDIAISILNRVNSDVGMECSLRLDNATVNSNKGSRDFIFRPTLDNSYAVFFPDNDYSADISSLTSQEMNLNTQSFLGKMGYSVNKFTRERRQILTSAVEIYGKRRVCDHLSFLISTRKAQMNGERKYVNAIHVWQQDLNFISEYKNIEF